MTTKIGITGANGHIGKLLLKAPNTFSLVGNVTNESEIEMAITQSKPDVVVHLASISDVDVCEGNWELAKDVNVRGTARVAEACLKIGCQMVLLSSVHVFNGKPLISSWGYSESSTPNPINNYGWTKFGAEKLQHIYPFMKIVRTSYLFDAERLQNQVKILHNGNYVTYPTFITRSFMYLPQFVEVFYTYLVHLNEMPKLLHIAGSEIVSWHKFMLEVASAYGINSAQVMPRSKELDNGLAPRPYKAGLNVDLSRKLHLPQYSYIDGIREMIKYENLFHSHSNV